MFGPWKEGLGRTGGSNCFLVVFVIWLPQGRSSRNPKMGSSILPCYETPCVRFEDALWSNVSKCLQEEFEEYAEKAKKLPASTTDADKLILYGLYKQATVGKVNTSRPGVFNLRDRAKWDAWKAVEDKSQTAAMEDYITKVKQLQEAAA